MSVGILLVTHGHIGHALLESIRHIYGSLPFQVDALGIESDMAHDSTRAQIRALADKLNEGDGVLILTDLIGATPCNSSCKVPPPPYPIKIVTGVNLPMLMKLISPGALNLDVSGLSERITRGGGDGIMTLDLLYDGDN